MSHRPRRVRPPGWAGRRPGFGQLGMVALVPRNHPPWAGLVDPPRLAVGTTVEFDVLYQVPPGRCCRSPISDYATVICLWVGGCWRLGNLLAIRPARKYRNHGPGLKRLSGPSIRRSTWIPVGRTIEAIPWAPSTMVIGELLFTPVPRRGDGHRELRPAQVRSEGPSGRRRLSYARPDRGQRLLEQLAGIPGTSSRILTPGTLDVNDATAGRSTAG